MNDYPTNVAISKRSPNFNSKSFRSVKGGTADPKSLDNRDKALTPPGPERSRKNHNFRVSGIMTKPRPKVNQALTLEKRLSKPLKSAETLEAKQSFYYSAVLE